MCKVIQRGEDGNERSREGCNGRIYESKSLRVVWIVKDGNGEFLGEYERLKDARRAYPDAVLQK